MSRDRDWDFRHSRSFCILLATRSRYICYVMLYLYILYTLLGMYGFGLGEEYVQVISIILVTCQILGEKHACLVNIGL